MSCALGSSRSLMAVIYLSQGVLIYAKLILLLTVGLLQLPVPSGCAYSTKAFYGSLHPCAINHEVFRFHNTHTQADVVYAHYSNQPDSQY